MFPSVLSTLCHNPTWERNKLGALEVYAMCGIESNRSLDPWDLNKETNEGAWHVVYYNKGNKQNIPVDLIKHYG